MRKLSVYEQAQFGILAAFFLGLVVTGSLVIGTPSPAPAVTSLFDELKTLFLGLLSLTTLKNAIARDNNETDAPPTPKGEKNETIIDTPPVTPVV